MTVKLNANEVVLNAGDTNQVIDNNKVEGKLIVTNQRIYFKALQQEAEKFNLEILFDNILEVIQVTVFTAYHFFPVPLINVDRVKVIELLVGTKRVHISVDTVIHAYFVITEHHAFPFCQ